MSQIWIARFEQPPNVPVSFYCFLYRTGPQLPLMSKPEVMTFAIWQSKRKISTYDVKVHINISGAVRDGGIMGPSTMYPSVGSVTERPHSPLCRTSRLHCCLASTHMLIRFQPLSSTVISTDALTNLNSLGEPLHLVRGQLLTRYLVAMKIRCPHPAWIPQHQMRLR